MAGALLKTLSEDDHTRARLMTEYKSEVDYQSKMVHARREGIREGIKEGMKERSIEIARNLLKLGIPFEKISEGTGLTIDEVTNL